MMDGKVALVSGGARGMGASHARGIVEHGGAVVIGDILKDEGAALAAELGDSAVFVDLDVTDELAWERAVAVVLERFGGLDVLVNNAGIADVTPIVSLSAHDYRRVIDVNQVGVFLGMKAAIVPMARRGGGSIINISSVAGLEGSALGVAYTASKFAARGMTKAAALELAPVGIRVNSVHPGFIDTPMLATPGVDLHQLVDGRVPNGRVATPAEVTQVVLFLASDASSYCSGAEFVVDGGLSAGIFDATMAAVATEAIRALQ